MSLSGYKPVAQGYMLRKPEWKLHFGYVLRPVRSGNYTWSQLNVL